MELRHIYKIADIINENILTDKLPKSILSDLSITVDVSPTTSYGIDKEFYRMTHNDNEKGFVHSKNIDATISGVSFNIREKMEKR